MRAKSMVLILIALGCGLVASIAISQVMERGSSAGNAALETVQIYVATSDIDVNEQITASNVRVEDWPKTKIPEGAVLDLDQINERFARVRFYEGEPILMAKLADEIEGAAIKIPEGFRVCSLKVQMDTAVSYLVNPGDRVDIFGYFRKGPDVPRTGTREILRNVRVFAVNSETEQELDQDGRAIVAKTVSVLVQHNQVAKLMLATELGTLRLALRRPNEEIDEATDHTATADSLFSSRPGDADPESKEKNENKTSPNLAAAASGFSKFLANLQTKQGSPTTSPLDNLPVARGPAWQMMVLTPEGGMNFTWDDVNRLPQPGGAAVPDMPPVMNTPTTPPVNGQPGAASATPDTPSDDGQVEGKEEEQQQEEDTQMVDD